MKMSSVLCEMGKRVVLLPLLFLLIACVPSTPEGIPTITLIADGETRDLVTEALTVRDVLTEAGVHLDENDLVVPVETAFVEDGMTIRVVRVDERTETEQHETPFDRQTVRDASVPAGETRLLQSGITGLEEWTYRIIIEDGVEVDRQLVRQVTLRDPRPEVVLIGIQADTKPVPITGTIAYIANKNAWVMQTTSPNQRRLTFSSDLDGQVFALSPDGSHLLFTRVPTDTGEGALFNTLWMIETIAADAEPVRLEAENVMWADWAPECEGAPMGNTCRVAYTTGSPSEGSLGRKAENDLRIVRPRASDGRLFRERILVEPSAGGSYGWWGTTYAWSPNGRYLAYARADEIGIVSATSGEQTALTQFPPYRTYASWAWAPTVNWSSKADFIITTLHGPAPTGEAPEDSPVFDVWVLAVDDSVQARLSSEAGMWAAPAYAPEGESIVFGRARSPYTSQTSGYDLYVMDSDGSNRRLLFPPEGEVGLEYHPGMTAWGPGGDQLLVIYHGSLHLLRIASGGLHQLTTDGSVTTVRWRW
jgi:hypothetical protein